MFGSIIDGIDSLLDTLSGALRQGMADFCDIETADDVHTLVAANGALVSIVRVDGMRQLVGTRTLYNQVVAPMKTALQSLFQSRAHQMQVWFEVDPDRTQEEFSAILRPSRETARRLSMDMDDLLEERERNMVSFTAAEQCYIALWTLPEALTKSETKTEARLHAKEMAGHVVTEHAQDPLRANSLLRNRHLSFVDAVCRECDQLCIVVAKLRVHEALRAVRASIDPGFTGPDWKPALPGDRMLPTQRKHLTARQEWEILWPPLSWQLCPRDANVVADNAVRIGDRVYAPIYVDLCPRDPEMFPQLFERTLSKRLPWRISFLIEGGGLSGFQFRGLLAQIVGFADSGNQMLKNAIRDLKAMEQEGETIIQMRIALATWAPPGKPDLLARRMSDLARCVESWGSCQVSEVTGDPLAGVASSALAFTQGSIATRAAAPMDDALAMMPWSRPCSPWRTGAVTWCSPDGKIMPYQPYSSIQASWINLIFARPGSGKSVLMNMMNLALCLAPGIARLPRIAIIDIGPSSAGLISLLREALPPNRRHLVAHRRLRMTESNAINPFDTQLGCRMPTALELMFLRNFLTLLVTDFDKAMPDKAMPGLVSEVIREMYLRRSDKAEPSVYTPGMVPRIDEALASLSIQTDRRTTWWELVDMLFLADEPYLAKVAQRYAVPLLQDAVGAAQSERIRGTYGTINVPGTGESLVAAFSRMISEALGFFPILARPTAFDAGEASVVAIDLDEVAKMGGAISQRVAAVMYMLARQTLAKDYYINEDTVQEMPAPENMDLRDSVPRRKYQEFHRRRIRELREIPKRICYDEFHRTANAEAVRDQVLTDMREGRKFQVDVMLASQALDDFDDNMIKFATGLFVMDGGNEMTVNEIATKFGFNDPAERIALQSRLRSPSRGRPGVFMSKFITSSGPYTLLLSAPLGPIELWAFSTTAEDVGIRSRLYESLGPQRARRVLALRYPQGSAKQDIEDRRERMKEVAGQISDDQAQSVTAQIVKELEDLAERKQI